MTEIDLDTERCTCGWPTNAGDAIAHCHQCHETLADPGEVFTHNLIHHPDLDAEPPRWPDGEICVDELTRQEPEPR